MNKNILIISLTASLLITACGGGSSSNSNGNTVTEAGQIVHCKDYVIEELNTLEEYDRSFRDLNTSHYLIYGINRSEHFLKNFSHDLNCIARDTETSILMTIDQKYLRTVISTFRAKAQRLIDRECKSSSLEYDQKIKCKKLKDALN